MGTLGSDLIGVGIHPTLNESRNQHTVSKKLFSHYYNIVLDKKGILLYHGNTKMEIFSGTEACQ